MIGYIDLFVLPLPKKHLKEYQKVSTQMGRIMLGYGALQYNEFVGDDLAAKGLAPFPTRIKLKPGEVLISAVVGFKSKSQRDQINKRIMKDERVKRMIEKMMKNPLHDPKRMSYGGFKTFVNP
jgi:uncharacterized protein YbaA (DUF1428 family)